MAPLVGGGETTSGLLQARRSAGAHGGFLEAGERPGGVAVGSLRPDEAVGGGEGVGALYG